MRLVSKILYLVIFVGLMLTFQNCSKSQSETGTNPTTQGIFDVCPSGVLTESSKTIKLKGDCLINGDINLSGTASLTMSSGILSVKGNIILSGDAQLTVTSGGITIPQTDYSQYSITLNDRSQMKLKDSTFVTNATQQNNFSMSMEAKDFSVVDIDNSILDTNTGSWLLGNFHNNSKLVMNKTQNIPTEIYPSGASQISISSSSEFASVWFEFLPGSNGIINIPTKDSQGNYNFNFAPTTGIAVAVNITASKGRLGLNSHPNSSMVVNGTGASGTNDAGIVFGYYVENSTGAVNINGLTVGNDITRQFTDQGRNLQLNHVNLNPFSWQLYVSQSNGFAVSVTNSIINEVGVLHNGLLNITSCVLQLAILGAHAPGSKITISGSHIWSQAVLAQNGGEISISNSQLHGNYISATGAGSKITMSNVGDAKNGVSPQSCTAVGGYPPNNNGTPLCNPFNTLYQCAQVVAPTGGAVITATPSLSCP